MFAVGILLARPNIAVAGWPVTPATALWAASALWYLTRGNLVLGLAVSLANLALILAALPLAQLHTVAWLAWGLGTFVVGWVIQFVGHYYEGKKPAFVDDLRGLLVGPMFVTGEALFALGWGKALLAEIEAPRRPDAPARPAHPGDALSCAPASASLRRSARAPASAPAPARRRSARSRSSR